VRKPRNWEPGGIYHLTPTGNADRQVFVDNVDRQKFLDLAGPIAKKYGVTIIGYCLMGNHLHFLVISGPLGLSGFLQALLGRYARWFNKRHDSEGHLFENHCHCSRVETDAYLWNVASYIDLNPEDRPEEWRWSSYRAHVGLEKPAPFLENDTFLRYFGPTREKAMSAYARFLTSAATSRSGRTPGPG
jgi:REP element-mobilizing transposase RayT